MMRFALADSAIRGMHRPVVYERYLALRLQIVHDSSLLMLLGALRLRYVYMRRISPVGRANPGYK